MLPVFAGTGSRGGWQQLDSGVTQDLNGVSFICLNRGSVAGDQGAILRTGDGGISWTIQDSGVTENLYDISYYGYTIVLAVGSSGTILFTNNSGQNWTVKQTGMMAAYSCGQMITDTVGVAGGENAIFQPFFTWTTDGWNTWESTSFYIENGGVMYEGRLSDVCFVNTSVGFATALVDMTGGGAIVRTMDGGNSWETVCFFSQPLYGIDVTYDGVVDAVGGEGTALRSLDNGQTWLPLDTGVTVTLHAVDFSSDDVGVAVGDQGVICGTRDGGVSWTVQDSGTTVTLLDVQCVTEQLGFAVGEQGVILRTTTGGYPDDTFPPVTTCTLEGTMNQGVFISNVTVVLNATDDFSGVGSTMFSLDNGSWMMYSGPFLVTTDGTHSLRFYSTDNAGNVEEVQTKGFMVQRHPVVSVGITGRVGLQVVINNVGVVNLTDEPWNLSVSGGLLLLGRSSSGLLDIPGGQSRTLNKMVVGVGKVTISFSIASTVTHVQGTVLLFFVRIT